MRRNCLFMAMALFVAASQSVWADDNQIAQHIIQRLKTEQQRGNLQGFHVDLRVDQGTVWFEGFVSNEDQEQLILRTAQQAGHLGVVQIVDDIDVRPARHMAHQGALIPVQESYGRQAALPASYNQAMNTTYQPMNNMNGYGPSMMSQAPVNVGYHGNPLPMSHSAAPLNSDNPNLPGYAWPGYAAHPNYAAVTYPRQYSASAWPYIGPFYPYPQVPMGWRKVTLEWDDGWWYLDFNDHHR